MLITTFTARGRHPQNTAVVWCVHLEMGPRVPLENKLVERNSIQYWEAFGMSGGISSSLPCGTMLFLDYEITTPTGAAQWFVVVHETVEVYTTHVYSVITANTVHFTVLRIYGAHISDKNISVHTYVLLVL